MKSKIEYSGNLKADILTINDMDEIDYEFVDYEKIIYEPSDLIYLENFLERNRGTLVVVADCDADGLSSAGVVFSYFPGIPIVYGQRNGERGLTEELAHSIYRQYAPTGILTVDCGTSNFDGIRAAHELGIEVFVTDHHQPEDVLPKCEIINPYLENVLFKDLCGASLIYTCLYHIYGESKDAVQYAGIGAICDVVTLLHDNRAIVKQALNLIRVRPAPSIQSILKELNITNITEKSIAWFLGPALNAASRMNSISTAHDAYILGNINAAKQLNELNSKRKKLTATALKKANITLHENFVIAVIPKTDFSIGGIVAMKLASMYYKPCIVCSPNDDGTYSCSMRTLDAINAADFIINSDAVEGGGHYAAAGFTITKNFPQFIEELNTYVKENPIQHQQKEYFADIDISLQAAVGNYKQYTELSPYGAGFKQPIFLTKNIYISAEDCSYTQRGHLRINLGDINCYYYNPPTIQFDKMFDIAYELDYNPWQKKVQIIAERIEPSEQ